MYKLIHGNSLEELKKIDENSIDSIITDPPYELNFMNNKWDNTGIAFNVEIWKECLRVLKHGGHLISFSGSRTYHRMAVAIEDAGFEIRDQLLWIYGSGFPKSHDIAKGIDKSTKPAASFNKNSMIYDDLRATTLEAKKWEGWGTALKPAHEPMVLARKPLSEKTIAQNVLKWGVGGINIDECRIEYKDENDKQHQLNIGKGQEKNGTFFASKSKTHANINENTNGRFPSNLIIDESKEVKNIFPQNLKQNGSITKEDYKINNQIYGEMGNAKRFDAYEDSGGADRYFYSAKCSTKDREEGLEEFEEKDTAAITDFRPTILSNPLNWNNGEPIDNPMMRITKRKNTHPTVKPTNLMYYLIKLITPKDGVILDPFNGSGSTGKAAMLLKRNYKYIGIDLEEEYIKISKARIEWAIKKSKEDEIIIDGKQNENKKENEQLELWDFLIK